MGEVLSCGPALALEIGWPGGVREFIMDLYLS